MGVQREREGSLGLGVQGGHEGPHGQGSGADEIAPVGSPEGEARLVRSTEQRSWPGDATGAESTLAKMSEDGGCEP